MIDKFIEQLQENLEKVRSLETLYSHDELEKIFKEIEEETKIIFQNNFNKI